VIINDDIVIMIYSWSKDYF